LTIPSPPSENRFPTLSSKIPLKVLAEDIFSYKTGVMEYVN